MHPYSRAILNGNEEWIRQSVVVGIKGGLGALWEDVTVETPSSTNEKRLLLETNN